MSLSSYTQPSIEEDKHWWFASRTRALTGMMDRLLPSGGNLKVLDVGCGAGNMIHHLQRYGQVKGLEIDPRPVAKARERGFDVEQFDATQPMPFPVDSFEVVTALDVIEHNQDDLAILKDSWRILKPGGLIVITTPAFMTLWSHNDELNAHIRRYTGQELSQKLDAAGFEIRRMAYNNFFIFPLAAGLIILRRQFQKAPELASHHISPQEYQVEMEPAAPFTNKILTLVGWLEAQILKRVDLPFGTSIIAIGQKPAAH
jgi:SAM-dependent methyltransferase